MLVVALTYVEIGAGKQVVGVFWLKLDGLTIVVNGEFNISSIGFGSCPCGKGDSTVGMLLAEHVQVVHGLSVALVLLTKKGKAETCLKVGRDDGKQSLVVLTSIGVSACTFVGIGAIEKSRKVVGVAIENDVVFVAGVVEL